MTKSLAALSETQAAHFALVRARAEAVPAGRWWWDIRPESKSVTLIAPGNGGDTVLTAHRWGFNGATLWMPSAEEHPILKGLEEDAVAFPNREHHRWARTSERPTAVFLANARRDIDFLSELVQQLSEQLLAAKGEEVADV